MNSHESKERGKVNPEFVDVTVDFVRTYADNCHHGKEEKILFRDLERKPLTSELERILNELIEEHRRGREVVRQLVEAKEQYLRGGSRAVSLIVESMRWLVDFYPKHIEKEDRHFFLPCMGYFTQDEREAMLNEEMDFDRNFVHARYKTVVESAERVSGLKREP